MTDTSASWGNHTPGKESYIVFTYNGEEHIMDKKLLQELIEYFTVIVEGQFFEDTLERRLLRALEAKLQEISI